MARHSLFRFSHRTSGDGDDWTVEALVLATGADAARELVDHQVKTLQEAQAWPSEVPVPSDWAVQKSDLASPGVLSLALNRVTDNAGNRSRS